MLSALTLALASFLLVIALPVNNEPTRHVYLEGALPKAAEASYSEREGGNGDVRKLVILLTVNTGYLDFFRNWLHYFRRLGLGLFVVIAEDENAYDVLYHDATLNMKGRVVSAVNDPLVSKFGNISNPQQSFDFRTPGFSMMVNRRPVYLKMLLELGYDVLYTDVDMVWLQDPLPHIYSYTKASIVIQSDPSKEQEQPSNMACTGFMFFKSEAFAIDMMNKWIGALSRQKPGAITNQGSFSDMLRVSWPSRRSMIAYLPFVTFPNGALYFNATWRDKQTESPVIIHNNFISGHDNKKKRFEALGLWHPVEL